MSQNPDVLMLGWEWPPFHTGGLGVACYGLTKGLAAQGAHVAFVMPKILPDHLDYLEILNHDLKGVDLFAVNSPLTAYQSPAGFTSAPDSSVNTVFGSSIYEAAFRYADSVSKLSQSRRFDLIHAHDWMTYPAALQVQARSSKPFIAHVHATEFDRTGNHPDTRIAEIEYQGLQRADQVITVSQYTKNMIADRYAVAKDKITVVHNGHETKTLNAKSLRQFFPNDQVVIFVGRLTFQKGVEYFLQAASLVLNQIDHTLFLVVGDGDLYQQHLLQAAQLGISQKVIFTGFLQGKALQSIYQLADVFVMPSVSEPYGLVALEAITAGVPAILSRNSGVSEALDHVRLCDFWDTDLMAAYIIQALAYPVQARTQNRQAQKAAAALTWDQAAGRTLSVYRRLLS